MSGTENQSTSQPQPNQAEAPAEAVPWPQEVDGAALLTEIATTFKRFCILPPHASDVLAVWVLFTYCYLRFEFAAVMAVWSPEPECGKGRVLDVTEALAFNSFRTANTSAAVLYYSVNNGSLTVLIDELDSQSPEQREAVSNILKSGFQSNGRAHRMAERYGEQVVVEFSTYAPKMIAAIGLHLLDKATRTRAIGIRMQRKLRDQRVEKFRRYDGTEISRKCMRWAGDNAVNLEAVGPLDLNECATDRQEDIWEPLVTVARVAGGDWEARIREAAGNLSGGSSSGATEGIGHQLLAATREVFARKGDRMVTGDLINALHATGDFADANYGRGLTAHFIAKHLKSYGIETRVMKLEGKSVRGYDREDFEAAFSAYLPAISGHEKCNFVTTPANIEENAVFGNVTDPAGYKSKNTTSPNENEAGYKVTFPDAKTEEEALL